MKSVALIFVTIVIVIFSSCLKDDVIVDNSSLKEYPLVDRELWSYYASFEEEANLRNISIDLKSQKISGVIKEIESAGVAGSCNFGPHIDNHVTIDKSFWTSAHHMLREFVVFHELGHCVLLRGHNESSDDDGRCISIMRSGLGDCVDVYSPANRKILIDELFLSNL